MDGGKGISFGGKITNCHEINCLNFQAPTSFAIDINDLKISAAEAGKATDKAGQLEAAAAGTWGSRHIPLNISVKLFLSEAGSNSDAAASSSATNQSKTLKLANPKQDPHLTAWDLVAQAIDRTLFILYLLIVVLFMAVYLRGG